MNVKNNLIRFSLVLLICSCNLESTTKRKKLATNLPEKIDYNFHVKPILSDRCFACHGPDAQNREAELRLDVPEEAYAALKSGNGHAIVPGKTGQSLLIDRILSDDPKFIMPPPESNLVLSEHEKAILVKWIRQRAVYKPHWAFTKPEKPPVPKAGKDWARNEVDRFVAHRLEQNDIQPAPEARKEQLIRRLFFDITGLPPNLTELDHWMAADEEEYYERLTEELLSRPAYGERMAAHWLDVARFADSEGYLDDFHHTFWPYRDWVIKAYNANLPYDDFVLWQVGGDQIPGASTDQVLATAFNRNHKQNSEGGIIPEEFRVEHVADRTNTIGAAFMGLTVGCARCHDHKYDPFSQENYYELFSFFNSTVERGDAIFSLNAIEYGQQVSNYESMNAGPVLALPDPEVTEIREFLQKKILQKRDSLQQLAGLNEERYRHWSEHQQSAAALKRLVRKATVSHLTFDDMANGKATDQVPGNTRPSYWGSIAPAQGVKGKALKSNAHGQFVADGISSTFERMQPFTVSFWVNTPRMFNRAHVIYNGNNRIQGYRGWDVVLDSNQVRFRLNHAHPYQSLEIGTEKELKINEWTHFVWTYDGSGRAEGMKLYRNGQAVKPEIHRNFLYRSTKPYLQAKSTVYMPYKGIIIGNRHYDQDFTDGLVDELQILNRESGSLAALYLFDRDQGEKAFLEAAQKNFSSLKKFYDLFVDPDLEQLRIEMRDLQLQEITAIDTVQEIMVMGDFERERPTYVLDRGVYDAHGKKVDRSVPESILPWPEGLPRNRYGLGRWLTHPDHPLTARVAVNQMWYLVFGRGLVETVEDFGNQGALPTHPDLLDWLAVDFQENGWDVKRLMRQLVNSATYRQSSRIRPELEDTDPDNYLLARGQRYRRSAEMVRDNILAASGLLDPTVGGPSVFPYQPPGLWKEVMTHTFFPEYEIDYENGLYRRSIYTFWKRNMPPPSMLIFDAASRGECQMRRQRSSTPLQALVLMNDPQMVEGCRVLAENMLRRTGGDIGKALQAGFRQLTGRNPNEREAGLLMAQFREEYDYFDQNKTSEAEYLGVGHRRVPSDLMATEIAALARVTNTVLNSTEAYFKN